MRGTRWEMGNRLCRYVDSKRNEGRDKGRKVVSGGKAEFVERKRGRGTEVEYEK